MKFCSNKEGNYLIFIFTIALFLRLLFLCTYQKVRMMENFPLAGDSVGYYATAADLLAGKGFTFDGKISSRHAPLYSTFLALIYFFFGVGNHYVVRIIQVVISALSVILIYFLGKEIFNQRIAIIASIISSLDYSLIQLPAYLVSETIFTFLLLLSLYWTLKLKKEFSFVRTFLVGLLWGLTSLCRAPALAFFSLVLLWFLINNSSLRIVIISLISFLLIIFPWTLRNYYVHKAFIPITNHFGELLYKGNSPYATGGTGGWHSLGLDFKYPQCPKGVNTEVEVDKFMLKEAMKYIKTHPLNCFYLAFKKFYNMWRIYHPESSMIGKIVMIITYGLTLPFVLIGIVLSKSYKNSSLLLILLLYWIIIHIILIGIIRYRYPVIPVLTIYAALGINFLGERFKNVF